MIFTFVSLDQICQFFVSTVNLSKTDGFKAHCFSFSTELSTTGFGLHIWRTMKDERSRNSAIY